jgi:hypothetical protein
MDISAISSSQDKIKEDGKNAQWRRAADARYWTQSNVKTQNAHP